MDLDRRSLGTVVELLAAEAAVTLQRGELLERLEAMARTDDLTGLPNRRAWEDQLPREMARALREGHELSVAMLDLDSFKEFNDEFGHQAGDRLLKEAAAPGREPAARHRPAGPLRRRRVHAGAERRRAHRDTGIIERLRSRPPRA